MLSISLKNINELYNLSEDLGILTYLQILVQDNKDMGLLYKEELGFSHPCIDYYLWERQLETVVNLRKLIKSKNFTTPIAE